MMKFLFKKYYLTLSKIVGLSFILLSVVSEALPIKGWQLKNSPQSINSNFDARDPLSFSDDITKDQSIDPIKLTPLQTHQALVWGLSDAEEKRYLLLMQNKSGLYYHNKPLTPIDILGINARSDEERNNYAARAAQLEFSQTAKLLAYQNAYHQAAQTIMASTQLPFIRPFDTQIFSPYQYQPLLLKPNDQLLLFVKKDNPVRAMMGTLLSLLAKEPKAQLNIYFIDAGITDKAIQTWANSQTIPLPWVNDQRITLNKDIHRYQQLSLPNKTTPLLLLVRDNTSQRIDVGRL